jgi:hypothetical protein
MSGNIGVWRRCSGNSGRCDCCGLVYGLTANSAKAGFRTVRFTTVRADRFEPYPAMVAKDRIRQILALTLRANHNGNQSQLGCIVFNSIKPVGAHGEGSKHCIVPAYGESKLKDRDNIDACLITNANRLSQTRKSGYGMRRSSPTLSRDDGGVVSATRPERLPP